MFDKYDPYAEYFVLVPKYKSVYIIRNLPDDKIFLISLKRNEFYGVEHLIFDRDKFQDLLDEHTIIKISTANSGCDYIKEEKEEQSKNRQEVFEYLFKEGYLK